MATKIQIRRDTAANWTSANPTLSSGEQGFETDTGKMKIGDGSTAWNSLSYFANSSGGIVLYDSFANFPGSPSEADLAYANDTNALYIYDGSAWQRISSGINESPEFTVEPNASYNLATDGTPTVISVTAVDPEGFDISYSYDTAPSDQAQANISVVDNTYTITPTTNTSNAGNFVMRFKASDGIHTSYRSSTMNLAFFEAVTFISDSFLTSSADNQFTYVSNNAQISSGGSRSNPLKLGRVYMEMRLDTVAAITYMFGLIPSAIADFGYNTTGCRFVYGSSGNLYPGNIGYLSSAPDAANDVIMIAYDTDTREIWFGVNGTWGQDPTASSSYTVGGSAGDTMSIGICTGGTANITGTMLQGGNLNYSVPAGFSSH